MCMVCARGLYVGEGGFTGYQDLSHGAGPDDGPLYFLNADQRGGGLQGGRPSFTSAQAGAHITRDNLSWSTTLGTATTVSFAFRSTGGIHATSSEGFERFNEAQINATLLALASWSDVANITFVRVGSGATGDQAYSDNAAMLFSNWTTGSDHAAGYAYYPGSRVAGSSSGDVRINGQLSYNLAPALFNYGQQVLVHEIGHAIGLNHPGSYNAAPGVTLSYQNNAEYYEDSRQYSVMSYWSATATGANTIFGPNSSGAYASAPLMDDISAAQRLYGANMTTRTGNTTYGFNSNANQPWFTATSANDILIFSVWDAGGIDTFDFSGFSENQRIDLRAGHFSDVGGDGLSWTTGVSAIGNVSIAMGVTIENGIGGSGDDTIIGNGVANVLWGNAGNDRLLGYVGGDVLSGGAGNDILYGGSGADTIDGGADTDTLLLDGAADLYSVTRISGGYAVSVNGVTDIVRNVERVSFDGGINSMTFEAFEQAAFDPYAYLVANPDLYAAYGVNAAAARSHYFAWGFSENRPLGEFDALRYIASNPDLIQAIGVNAARGASHYMVAGRFEGRTTAGFDPLVYSASHIDLALAFGTNATAAATHYIVAGMGEGRATNTFDARLYLASHRDLAMAYGDDAFSGVAHYLTNGAREGRATTGFDPLTYAASHSDLALAYRANAEAALTHYLGSGVFEGRATATFDARIYAASHVDLARIIGLDTRGALLHYLNAGVVEGRAATGFDPVAYLLTHSDLAGRSASRALDHYLIAGADEGRSAAGAFGLEQTSHPTVRVGGYVSGSTHNTTDKDWFGAELVAGQTVTINASRFAVSLYDSEGRLVASSMARPPSVGGHNDLVVTPSSSGLYYVVVSATSNWWGSYYLQVTAGSSAGELGLFPDADGFISEKWLDSLDDPQILPGGFGGDDAVVDLDVDTVLTSGPAGRLPQRWDHGEDSWSHLDLWTSHRDGGGLYSLESWAL